jgi:hypothetical protein
MIMRLRITNIAGQKNGWQSYKTTNSTVGYIFDALKIIKVIGDAGEPQQSTLASNSERDCVGSLEC